MKNRAHVWRKPPFAHSGPFLWLFCRVVICDIVLLSPLIYLLDQEFAPALRVMLSYPMRYMMNFQSHLKTKKTCSTWHLVWRKRVGWDVRWSLPRTWTSWRLKCPRQQETFTSMVMFQSHTKDKLYYRILARIAKRNKRSPEWKSGQCMAN